MCRGKDMSYITKQNGYDMIFQKEILLEAFAGLLCDFRRMMEQHGIDEDAQGIWSEKFIGSLMI